MGLPSGRIHDGEKKESRRSNNKKKRGRTSVKRSRNREKQRSFWEKNGEIKKKKTKRTEERDRPANGGIKAETLRPQSLATCYIQLIDFLFRLLKWGRSRYGVFHENGSSRRYRIWRSTHQHRIWVKLGATYGSCLHLRPHSTQHRPFHGLHQFLLVLLFFLVLCKVSPTASKYWP